MKTSTTENSKLQITNLKQDPIFNQFPNVWSLALDIWHLFVFWCLLFDA